QLIHQTIQLGGQRRVVALVQQRQHDAAHVRLQGIAAQSGGQRRGGGQQTAGAAERRGGGGQITLLQGLLPLAQIGIGQAALVGRRALRIDTARGGRV